MSFVNKRARVFMDRGDLRPVRRRSEARLKTYPSAVDLRAWCGRVEDRRQHILELIQLETERCFGKFVPVDVIISTLMADKNTSIKELKRCLSQLWNFLGGCKLRNEDRRKLIELKKQMTKICLDGAQYIGSDAQLRSMGYDEAYREDVIEARPVSRGAKSVPSKTQSVTSKTKSVTSQSRSKTSQPKLEAESTRRKSSISQPPLEEESDQRKSSTSQPTPEEESERRKSSTSQPTPEEKSDRRKSSTSQPIPEDESDRRKSSISSECPAKERHSREQAEIEALTRAIPGSEVSSSYFVKANGPVRISSKLKGLKGAQSPVGSIKVKAQTNSRNKSTFPKVKEEQLEEEPTRSSPAEDESPDWISAKKESDLEAPRRSADEGQPADDEQINGVDIKTERDGSGKTPVGEEKSSDDEEKADNMPDELQKLQDQLAARDALCDEQQNSINNLRNERDDLNKRIQDCLEELDALKKFNNVGDLGVPTSCKEEIEALEQEMLIMRSGNLSPEQEAEMIKKEVEMLKRYCLKLKAIEEENEILKSTRSLPSGDNEPTAVARIEQLERERDELAHKLEILEQEAKEKMEVPEDYEIYKNRSDMLDKALAERDEMQKKVDKMKQLEMQLEELREKAERTDELEKTLKYYNKNDRNTDYELKRTQSKCICLEKEQQNLRCERDSMCKRIEAMNNELESLRSKAKEAEMLKLERDRLQIKLNELSHVQVHNENLMLKCKCLENAVLERDAYKLKYEEILGMECQCEMMKLQIEESRNMARERDALVKQVMDLESCIREQEEEIKRLVNQIDSLVRNKDETQSRMREALSNMRAEVEKKDQLIAASEEKLAAVQTQLKSSIQGVSCETLCYKTRIEELERELCSARCRIGKLERQLTEKEEILRGARRTNKSEYETVGVMRRELDAAKAENNKLQEIAKKMVTLTGDEHVQKMLRQSECAVRRVVEELGKQYREWDNMRSRRQKHRSLPREASYKGAQFDDGSDFESTDEKLKEELRDIQREKEKLESIVKQIQNSDGPQKELVSIKMENERLQDQLRNEVERRRALEQKLNKILT
nr:intracellular protein transport protein USO1-like [Leptinotarsa decemlineata]